MPGWRALDDMLRDELRPSPAPIVPSPDLRAGVLNLFEPVLAVFEKLRSEGVRLSDDGFSGFNNSLAAFDTATLRQNLRSMSSPVVTCQLDRNTQISVRVAIRPDLPFPENITTAKWRCILTTNGAESDTQLYDNRDMMARWVIANVVSFARNPVITGMPVLRPTAATRDHDTPGREHRVIMVDDTEE